MRTCWMLRVDYNTTASAAHGDRQRVTRSILMRNKMYLNNVRRSSLCLWVLAWYLFISMFCFDCTGVSWHLHSASGACFSGLYYFFTYRVTVFKVNEITSSLNLRRGSAASSWVCHCTLLPPALGSFSRSNLPVRRGTIECFLFLISIPVWSHWLCFQRFCHPLLGYLFRRGVKMSFNANVIIAWPPT